MADPNDEARLLPPSPPCLGLGSSVGFSRPSLLRCESAAEASSVLGSSASDTTRLLDPLVEAERVLNQQWGAVTVLELAMRWRIGTLDQSLLAQRTSRRPQEGPLLIRSMPSLTHHISSCNSPPQPPSAVLEYLVKPSPRRCTRLVLVPSIQPRPLVSNNYGSSIPSNVVAHDGGRKEASLQTSKHQARHQDLPERLPPAPTCSEVPMASFPSKLFFILQQAQIEGHKDIISFVSDGKAFAIHQPYKFAEVIMPRYFRTAKLKSFYRQLNHYGFKRITFGQIVGVFYHEHFQRDDQKLVAKILRKPVLLSKKRKKCGGH